jgi:hypothetical protein
MFLDAVDVFRVTQRKRAGSVREPSCISVLIVNKTCNISVDELLDPLCRFVHAS